MTRPGRRDPLVAEVHDEGDRVAGQPVTGGSPGAYGSGCQ